jgi:hypothetical protein
LLFSGQKQEQDRKKPVATSSARGKKVMLRLATDVLLARNADDSRASLSKSPGDALAAMIDDTAAKLSDDELGRLEDAIRRARKEGR